MYKRKHTTLMKFIKTTQLYVYLNLSINEKINQKVSTAYHINYKTPIMLIS